MNISFFSSIKIISILVIFKKITLNLHLHKKLTYQVKYVTTHCKKCQGGKNNSCRPTDRTWGCRKAEAPLYISQTNSLTILHNLHHVKYCINKSTLIQGYWKKKFGTNRNQYFILADHSQFQGKYTRHYSLMFMLRHLC